MKRRVIFLLVMAMLVSAVGFAASASGDSVRGWYSLWVTMPADHDHVYVYDMPSSTRGNNLGRINNGEWVYVYWLTDGLNSSSSVWAYCNYNGVEGYIRFCNLVPEALEEWYGYDESCGLSAPRPPRLPDQSGLPPKATDAAVAA